jgi:acyl transferase domain-containing protein
MVGTGTPAGDPQEANAIASAFFGHEDDGNAGENPLFVGSIKTVVGHTEGTAGIAGLLKASLAVQHGTIPPNLLFNKLSPRVAPFYTNLQISTEAIPWPTIAPGQPRRVSVNSFGE